MGFNSGFKGLNPQLNPICHLLALLGAHPILHVSRIRLNLFLIISSILCKTRSRFFDVRKSMHHHTIQINQPTRCNSFTSLLTDVYVWLNMFRALSRPSSGAYNCISGLWFYRWSVVVAVLLVVVWQVITCQTTTNNAATATLQL